MKDSKQRAVLITTVICMLGIIFLPSENFNIDIQLKKNQPQEDDYSSNGFAPLKEPLNLNSKKIDLGRRLFVDKRFSSDKSVSCASCHSLEYWGNDSRQFSVGAHGKIGFVNSPSVFNAAFNSSQFWNGRTKSLVEQIKEPLHNSLEMDSTWSKVLSVLNSDPSYVDQFQEVYGKEASIESFIDALVYFEQSLVTINSPFDKYLAGDSKALSPQQLAGFEKFKTLGCASCHQGRNLGGNMFQTFGVARNYFRDRGGFYESDLGRMGVTGLEEDRHVFRVPSLRNVEMTAPYLHDGHAKTLSEVVRIMATYQLGRRLSPQEQDDLIAFLKSLTGEIPRSAIGYPEGGP